ncbi:hypothetical protein K501DRAFT_178779 [Backusella circina FSU 941]|nr:hypothetical protein K501DRAFT_178779 [Backusella circina FSU 941]
MLGLEETSIPNFATGQVVRDILLFKFYKDKLKTVVSCKLELNEFIQSYPSVKITIYIPSIIMAGMETTVYIFLFDASGFYFINEVAMISL